jgi:hypothetical protein
MHPEKAKETIRKVLELDSRSRLNLTTMLWGGPGVGKSSIVNQVAEDMGYEVREIRLSTLSPVDVRGVPYVDQAGVLNPKTVDDVYAFINKMLDKSANQEIVQIPFPEQTTTKLKAITNEIENVNSGQRFRFIPPEFMPTGTEEKPVLLFFDEVNTAVPANQVVAYEIALDRKMGGHKLPAGTAVIMAGNRMKDRGATYEMPAPLSNRLIHVEVEADVDQFIQYGMQNNFDENILAFLRNKPDSLETKPSSGNWAFPTPRTWEMASVIMESFPEHHTDDTLLKLTPLLNSTIGDGATAELLAYSKLREHLPDLNEILLQGKEWDHTRNDILYFYVITLSNRMIKLINKDKDKAADIIDNFINAIDALKSEMRALALNCVIHDKQVMLHMGRNRKLMNSIRQVLK